MVAGSRFDTPHFDPRLSSSLIVLQAIGPVYNKLLRTPGGVRMNPYALEVEPDLAERWEITSDAKTFTFYLRKGVRFQNLPPVNGREVTAQDVAYTLRTYKNDSPATAIDLQVIDTIETPDNYTVRLRLKEPSAPMMAILMQNALVILPKEVADKDGDFKKTAIGAGPFILDRFNVGASITFRRNPDYFEPGKPYLDGYKILIIKDLDTERAAFKTGQIDLDTFKFTADRPAVMEEFKSKFPDLAVIQYYEFPTGGGVQYDTKKPPYNDVRVRRALSLAWDRENMVKTLDPGWPVAWSLQLPWFYIFDTPPTLKDLGPWYQYDLAKAKSLLSEAGYPNGFNAGELLIGSTSAPDQMVWLQQDWKKIGVTFNLKLIDYVSYRTKIESGDYTLANTGIVRRNSDFDSIASLMYSKGPDEFRVFDAVLDQLIEAERKELDPAKRKAIFKQIWDRELDQMFRITYRMIPDTVMWRGYVRNIASALPMSNGGIGQMGRQISDIWLDERVPKRSLN